MEARSRSFMMAADYRLDFEIFQLRFSGEGSCSGEKDGFKGCEGRSDGLEL